jgi:hypothetical protein
MQFLRFSGLLSDINPKNYELEKILYRVYRGASSAVERCRIIASSSPWPRRLRNWQRVHR